jgi:lipoprotein-anchoring transpeptidase ErfK/SrfK
MRKATRVGGATVAVVPLLLALMACGGDRPPARWAGPDATSAPPTAPPTPLALTVTPRTDARNLPISAEIGTRVAGGRITKVTLTDPQGVRHGGRLRGDGSSWVPDRPLRYQTTYAARVTATGAGGVTQTKTTRFTTMGQPGNRVGTGLYLFDGVTYGVAMPVVVEFDTTIPAKARAGVEKRLFVATDPPQPGVWGWYGDRQVYYRAPGYWRPGTKLTVRVALDGHPMGNGRYGDTDRRAAVTITRNTVVLDVDNATKQMSVYRNDTLIKKMPVSLGKPATPSSSGTLVIMAKEEKTVFDTRDEPDPANRYRIDIEFAQRLTWGGEFVHAAPWSVQDQGVRNVSHGCVNLSWSNAQWLFSLTHVGDPVTVRGTEQRVEPGNGWTAWDLSWTDHVKRSALPPPDFVARGPVPPAH